MILATGMHSRMGLFKLLELSSMRVSTHGATTTATTTTTTTTTTTSSSYSRRKCCNTASSRADDDAAACYRKRACHHDDEADSIGELGANDAANVSRARKTSKPRHRGQVQRDRIRWERRLGGRIAGLGGTTACSRRRQSQQLMVLMSIVCQMTLMILLLLALGISESESFFIDVKQSPQTSEWNYGDQMRWRQMHRDCAGRAQSPIDIKHNNVIISQHLRLNFYNYDQQIRFKLANAHHTIKMNPLGPAYEQEFEQHGGGQRGGLNASSIHDIMTVDEYVEFTPNSNQQDSSGSGSSSGVSSGSSTPVGGGSGADSDHMSRLIIGAAARQAGSQQQRQLGARLAADPSQKGRDYERDRQASNDIELERERNHGHHASGGGSVGFGAGLFSGFHTGGKDRGAYDGAPTIKLDWLDDGNNEYKLRDIHFHWGERRDNGSEHAIDGRRAAMEMHLVHIKHGLDKSSIGFTSDSVAVIAVLIESHRKSNLDFNPIVNELARINATEQAREIDYKSLYDLLPNNLQSFYTYSGSLTTPPCYQVVNWIVMAERLNMNAKQIEMFRNLYAPPTHEQQQQQHHQNHNHHKDDNMAIGVDEISPQHNQEHNIGGDQLAAGGPGSHYELIMPNVRMLQPLNNRTILASFTKHGSRLESVTSSINSASSLHLSSSIQLEHACLQLALGGALFVFQSFSSLYWRRTVLL